MTRVALSLTSVEFSVNDPLGKLLAYVSLLPLAGLVSYLTLALLDRDLTAVMALGGQLANEALNSLLKALLRHPRPPRTIYLMCLLLL
jgi:dolichyldiphosphatase